MGHYPLSSIPYDLGFFILAMAMFRGAALLGEILNLLKGPRYNALMTLGAFVLLASVLVHVYASAFVLGPMAQAPADRFETLYREALFLKNVSLACLTLAGFLSAASGWLCYRQMNR